MYMIVAVVYLIAAGQPIGEPLSITHRETFTSLGACGEYLKSDKFAGERAALSERIKGKLQYLREANGDDDAVAVPDIAITASCQPDTRV